MTVISAKIKQNRDTDNPASNERWSMPGDITLKHGSRQATESRPASIGRTPSVDGNAVSGSLADAARQQLRSSADHEVRELTCEQNGEVLILFGQVSSWYRKQVAQEVIRRLPGIEEIKNCVEVVPQSPPTHRPDQTVDEAE